MNKSNKMKTGNWPFDLMETADDCVKKLFREMEV